MGDRPEARTEGVETMPSAEGHRTAFNAWAVATVLALILTIYAVVSRLAGRPGSDSFLIVILSAVAALLCLRLLVRTPSAPVAPVTEPHREVLDSAGPAILAMDADARLIYFNPAAERLFGYEAAELMPIFEETLILGPGEGIRLVEELERLGGVTTTPVRELNPIRRRSAYLECVRTLPPSVVPGFDLHIRRKDGVLIPATVHISALRDRAGSFEGAVLVAMDQGGVVHKEAMEQEAQERFRDLFENSSEMIATLSPAGRFLYANPAWKQYFGRDNESLLGLDSVQLLFESGSRAEVAALFRRALDGETVDRALLRHHTQDGRMLDLELSLSQRQMAGNPLAVRCLLRDVTQQKQREHRLALQLVVSQIVGENISQEVAAMRILEALCVSQGWDLAVKWLVDTKENRLEFCIGWGVPGHRTEVLIHESMGQMPGSEDLPGRVWKDGRAVWVADLKSAPSSPRIEAALREGMVSAWAVPVRVGNKVLAVLEFYCHTTLREDRESMAAVETVAASMGQMLARSQERGRAEELTRQQEILLDSVADGIFGVDRHGNVTFANPAAGRLLGAKAATLVGRPVHELLHGSAPLHRVCAEDCALRKGAETRKGAAGEDTIFRADGTAFPAEYVLTPLVDQGRFSGSVLSFRDISQRFALDRLKDEFISTVSHELRTPLTSIRGALGLLSSGILGEVSDKAGNLLRIALTNSDRLVRLINDILDLERIQSGREPLAFRPVQLGEIVRQAIDGMQPVADAGGVQLIHDTVQVEIAADPDRLLQVLTNLLSNAIKFSPPNSTISVMLRPGLNGVTLSVIDHGRGIPADKLEAIFGRFQQVDASDSRQKGGSGLGLAICRTIVLQHSGRIWAERNPVRGSKFRVYLPYHPAVLEGPIGGMEDEPERGTVLLAGASAVTRVQMAAQLTRHGYRVMEAETVEDTLAAAHGDVQAILLDTSLDRMNGWELLPMLRRLDPEGRTPVVLLSVEEPKKIAELPEGAAGWVEDPLLEDALLGELARVLCGVGEKARILIIEDDVDLARIIAEVFARESISIEVAHTFKAAMHTCFEFQPQLIVLDIGLPDGDGFNLVDWLRKDERLARLPLVVYSGREISAAERKQLTLGPTHFLAKARVQPQQLEALVLTMLHRSRQLDEASKSELPVSNK